MDYTLLQAIDRFIRPLRSRLSHLIQPAVIHKTTDTGMQVSLAEGDTQDGVRDCAHFGFASHPPASSQALVLFPSGSREVGLCISTNSKKGCPVTLHEGESAQYNNHGSHIALKKDGKVEIKNQTAELIDVLCDLVGEVEKISQISALGPPPGPAGTYPGGQCTISIPGFNVSSVKGKLNSFRSGS